MKSLSDMGFSDSASTRAALETAKGDVGRAIETLLGKGLAAGATSQPQPLRERNAVGTPIGCGRGKKRAAPRAAGQGSIDSMFAKQQRH